MIANLELTRLVNPQNPNALFELARAFAIDRQKKNATETLEQAVKNGFADCGRLREKPELEILRGEKQFQKIIELLKCQKD